MRLSPSHALASVVILATSCPLFAMPHPHRGPTSPKARSHAVRSASHASSVPVGMASARATQIQNALIKNGYMSGEPTGVWDSSSQTAMLKLQVDNGWQTKLVPDSRALIKLGLGPGSNYGSETTEAATGSEANHSIVGNQ